jgi:hypothetical protein
MGPKAGPKIPGYHSAHNTQRKSHNTKRQSVPHGPIGRQPRRNIAACLSHDLNLLQAQIMIPLFFIKAFYGVAQSRA